MRKNYEPETKKQIVRLHLEQGRTIKSLSEEYGVSTASVSNWVNQFRKECQNNSQAKEEYDSMQEILKLRKELAEARKENEFLKNENQQADYGIFCEGDRLEAYRFIQSYHEIFGTRWLLRKFNICP
ncbi:transposase, partial [[Clostridium] polysaccharolyticum]